MAEFTVNLNAKPYVVVPRRSGEYVDSYLVKQYGESFRPRGGQLQGDLKTPNVVFYPPTYGFGRDRMPSDKVGDPIEARRFWDSTCETRFPGDVRLGLLQASCTGEVASSRLVAHCVFAGALWTMWQEENTAGAVEDIKSRSISSTTVSGGGDIATEAVASDGIRGFDLKAPTGRLLALVNIYATQGYYRLYRSDAGTGWTAGADTGAANILSQTDRQSTTWPLARGKIAPTTIGGEVVVAVYDSNSTEKKIYLYSTTDDGATMALEAPTIRSGDGPLGVVVYPDTDGTDKLYVGTAEGLYLVDPSAATWTATKILPLPYNTSNFAGMTVHQGKLWFSVGVPSNNHPAVVYTMEVSGDTRIFNTQMGLNVDDGVPSDMLGQVYGFESTGKFLFAIVGGAAASRNARVICHNGFGWHSVYKNGTANQQFQWMGLGTSDNLYYTYYSSGDVVEVIANATTEPSSGVTRDCQASGVLDLPETNGGMPTTDGALLQVRLEAADLSAADTGEYVNADYGVNGAARTTDVGNFLSGTKTLTLASGAGIQAVSAALRLIPYRDAGNTTDSPKVRSVEVVYDKLRDYLEGWVFTVDLRATARLQGAADLGQVATALRTALALATLPAFDYANSGTKYVRLAGLSWRLRPYQESGSDVGGSVSDVIGYVEVTVEEIV